MRFPLSRYRHLIDLDGSPVPLPAPSSSPSSELAALHYLYREYHGPNTVEGDIGLSDLARVPVARRHQLLRSLLTLREPSLGLPPRAILDSIEAHLLSLSLSNPDPLQPAASLPSIAHALYPSVDTPPIELTKVAVWRGDMTRLQGARVAVVNAANTRMLGCFQPSHLCIDNVLHAGAGPRLRDDCFKIVTSPREAGALPLERPEEAPVAEPLLTRGHCLPAGFVLHVAGPQLEHANGKKKAVPSIEDETLLAKAYENCLDLAEESGLIDTVAFPCISTGLFAFPADRAALIAVRTVLSWLRAHPSSSLRPIFVLFSAADASHYSATLTTLFPGLPPALPIQKHVVLPDKVREWVRDADSIVVHAGAGLSADAVNAKIGLGLDYTSKELFRKLYPGLLESTEMQCLYDSIGYQFDDDLVKWAYFLAHVHTVLNWGPTPVYTQLLSLVSSKPHPYTIKTSNADQLFHQSHLSPDRIWTPQGSYTRFQCLANCEEGSWFEALPWAERAREFIRPETMRLPEGREDLIPTCDKCGGEVFLNVRGGDWFNEKPMKGQSEAYQAHVSEAIRQADAAGKHVLVLEIGAGFNTPSVIRFPGEALVRRSNGLVKMIRVNLAHPEVPPDISENAVGLKLGALEFLQALE